MIKISKLFYLNLRDDNDFIEIGGGEGYLSNLLINSGFRLVLFIEPDKDKFKIARKKLKNVDCLNSEISEIDCKNIKSKSTKVTVVMQDVIEHISGNCQEEFFLELNKKYKKITLIGRTPNLKSPFGLRNSFGDNTHINRFTDSSLNDFLCQIGFQNIKIKNENYSITGIISFARYPFYLSIILFFSFMFLFVYGSWEGFLSPNIVFKAEKF